MGTLCLGVVLIQVRQERKKLIVSKSWGTNEWQLDIHFGIFQIFIKAMMLERDGSNSVSLSSCSLSSSSSDFYFFYAP